MICDQLEEEEKNRAKMVSRVAATLLVVLAVFGSSALARPGYAVDYYVRVLISYSYFCSNCSGRDRGHYKEFCASYAAKAGCFMVAK